MQQAGRFQQGRCCCCKAGEDVERGGGAYYRVVHNSIVRERAGTVDGNLLGKTLMKMKLLTLTILKKFGERERVCV